jgi:predicted dehydrogenase
MDKLRVGIVGCGLIGNKRAKVVMNDLLAELRCVADKNLASADDLIRELDDRSIHAYSDWNEMLEKESLDVVIAATPNKYLKDIVLKASASKVHVLCEKPLGRNTLESQEMVNSASKNGVVLKTGFNHRYHPAIFKAHQLLEKGVLGKIYFARCIYGHGGRPGYESEWRACKDVCGGGELLDQGVHVVDLFRWFLGEFDEAFGFVPCFHWNMEVEDNAFALFRTATGQTAFMHTSWTQWKNRFTFEVFGEAGYLVINGLGGSYGKETLTIGKRPMNEVRTQYIGGVPEEEIIIFEGPDISWDLEWKEFTAAIKERREPLGSGEDGLEANRMITAVYQSAAANRPVKISNINE